MWKNPEYFYLQCGGRVNEQSQNKLQDALWLVFYNVINSLDLIIDKILKLTLSMMTLVVLSVLNNWLIWVFVVKFLFKKLTREYGDQSLG
jgi:hypothetical protein